MIKEMFEYIMKYFALNIRITLWNFYTLLKVSFYDVSHPIIYFVFYLFDFLSITLNKQT